MMSIKLDVLLPVPIINVRCVGNVFEARTADGLTAAIGFSPEDAVEEVERKLGPHVRPTAMLLKDPYHPEEFDSDPEDELEGGR
ncbi:MAG: hypothetical protein AAB375_00540 [Patescibacteria group bacterium]